MIETRKYGISEVLMDAYDSQKSNVVYCLLFPNNKRYIGITKRKLYLRISNHACHSEKLYSSESKTIKARAIRKYRKFSVSVLYSGPDILKQEIFFIEKYDTTNDKFGYNISKGGIRLPIIKHLTDKQKNNNIYEWNKKNGFPNRYARLGRHHSGEYSERMSKILTGKHVREVERIDNNGTVIEKYDSVKSAALAVGVAAPSVSHAATHGTICVGNKWRYINH